MRNDDYVLHELLSNRVHITYNLRTRCHDRTIPEKKGRLAEKNFITGMQYKKCVLILLLFLNFNWCILSHVPLRFGNCVLHE